MSFIGGFVDDHCYIASGIVEAFACIVQGAAEDAVARKKITLSRLTARLLLGFIGGLLMQKWYETLDLYFDNSRPIASAIAKVAVDHYFLKTAYGSGPTQFINFCIIPLNYQVTFNCVCKIISSFIKRARESGERRPRQHL